MSESVSKTGGVRQSCPYDFASLPVIGLLGLARTAQEGGEKYGRFNYMRGMNPDELINHAITHLMAYLAGDRSEPHAFHAAWSCLVLGQQAVLNPEMEGTRLLGPGMTIPDTMREDMEIVKAFLAERRRIDPETGKPASGYDFSWSIETLPIVKEALEERNGNKTGVDV